MTSARLLTIGLVLGLGSTPLTAQIIRHAEPAATIAESVRIPAGAEMVFVSGLLADSIPPEKSGTGAERFGDTEIQTRSVLTKLDATLRQQGMSLADVVMMRIYLVAPPGSDKMDFEGMMRAYRERFATITQPNRPSRVTVQVASLVAPEFLVEIEVQAASVVHKH